MSSWTSMMKKKIPPLTTKCVGPAGVQVTGPETFSIKNNGKDIVIIYGHGTPIEIKPGETWEINSRYE